jgi:trimeric autotransporter adhesin
MKHVTFHLPSFLRRVRIHGGEFDSSARAMNREEQVRLLQAEPRIVRGSTIERKHMSTKTTFKRIALVAVAALGFGVLSVVPSQAAVSALTVSAATAGTAGAVGAKSDSTTASTFSVSALFDAGLADTVTVSFVQNGDYPATAVVTPLLTFLETTTAATTQVDTTTVQTADGRGAAGFISAFSATAAGSVAMGTGVYSISRTDVGYAGAKFGIYLDSTTSTTRPAGAYNFTIIVRSFSGGVAAPVTTTYPATITVAAAPAAVVNVPASASAKAIIEAGNPATVTSITDSATSGSFTVATTPIGKILVSNFNTAGATASDTITAVMTGPGYINDGTNNGRRLVVFGTTATFSIFADGTSGEGVITITTAAGASFVKKATFFDTKPVTATAVVAKAFIKAGTTAISDVFAITVKDTLGNAIKDAGAVVTAAPTDTATTVGGAATCAWNVAGDAYHCSVAGKAADKFGPVAYTFTATGTGINAATKVTTSATVTFSDNVATKAVLAGPATGTPGATAEYTLTLTDKNGYAVADQTYGKDGLGGALFSTTAADTVASAWGTLTPFSASESYTSKSGVITGKGVLPIAGVASLSLTLVGDGIATSGAIDKTIGKTKVTVSTEVSNPGVDAATDAANEATDAANAATDAALAAAEAADAATTAAQEASDAVAALSASVTKLIEGLQAQIKSLAAVVAKIAKKVKA